MRTALVGYSGFVGGNLLRVRGYDELRNSSNSAAMVGQHYDLVVFAAARAEKWRSNQDPDADAFHIAELERLLGSFATRQLVLVSTVDVYKSPVGVFEDTPVDTEGLHPYGLHRYRLEQSARSKHENTLVVRLPGLFGAGLKKNVIYDLLHGNNVDRIHHASSFQYYNLAHLADDIDTALAARLDLVNLTSAPIRTDQLARDAFGIEFANEPAGVAPVTYDMRTRHASVFGGTGDYTNDQPTTLAELRRFVTTERTIPAGGGT